MVIMPEEFVATWFPGYFWNTKTKTLFTAKLGVLVQMKRIRPNFWSQLDGYKVSHKGKRYCMGYERLCKLKPSRSSVFPVQFTTVKSNTNDDVAINMGKLPAGTPVKVTVGGYIEHTD